MDLLKDFEKDNNSTLLYKIYGGIGDLLWRTALFRELKRRNPNMKLIISGRPQTPWKLVFKNNPYIDELRESIEDHELNLKDINVYVQDDVCPHVSSNYAKKLHAIDALGKWAGIKIYNKSYWYETTKEEKIWRDKFLNNFKNYKIAGVALKSSTWVRTWNPIETKKIIKLLLHNGYKVILMDINNTELKDKNIVSMAGGYTIREVAAIIEKLDLLITPDTGFLHFGGHFKIPTIAIFGGTSPELRTKYYSTVVPIVGKNKLKCWPCYYHLAQCPYGIPSPCISQICMEDVLKEINNIT